MVVFGLVGGRLFRMFLFLILVIVLGYIVDVIFGIVNYIYSTLMYIGISVTKISVSNYITYALWAVAIGSVIGLIIILLTSIREGGVY